MGNSDLLAAIFTACHERPWGSLAIIDRKKGVDGIDPVIRIWPANSIEKVKTGGQDAFIYIDNFYEDPFPVDENNLLVSRSQWFKRERRSE
jgi:hypothetical protein